MSPRARGTRTGAGAPAGRRQLGYVIFLLFTVGSFLETHQLLPGFIFKLCLITGAVYLVARVATFPRWADERAHVPRFAAAAALTIAAVTVENFFTWIVSATDQGKYEFQPLQDNVRIMLRWAAAHHPLARRLLSAHWSDLFLFLLALLALPFSVLWDQVPYSGFGMMSRVLTALGVGRLLRVACYMCTVLPSAIPRCYQRRFPPVPGTFWGVVRVGFSTLRGFGGCNDLLFSGHAAFWALVPLAYQTYYGRRGVTALLWAAFAHMCMQDIATDQHYSVDMVVALLVSAACWTWSRGIYPEAVPLQPWPRGPDAAGAARPPVAVVALVASTLALGLGGVLLGRA